MFSGRGERATVCRGAATWQLAKGGGTTAHISGANHAEGKQSEAKCYGNCNQRREELGIAILSAQRGVRRWCERGGVDLLQRCRQGWRRGWGIKRSGTAAPTVATELHQRAACEHWHALAAMKKVVARVPLVAARIVAAFKRW